MLHLHSSEALEPVRTGRNVDLSAVLSQNTSHPRQIFQNIFTKGITIKKKRLLYRTEPIFPMLTGLFQVCAKQKCSSVSHWFGIILTIHMSKHMRFFPSKLNVF